MKERPILFSGPMIRAILDGRKTMTRRAISKLPETTSLARREPGEPQTFVAYDTDGFPLLEFACRYGQPGDRLWCKEAWRLGEGPEDCGDTEVHYRADEDECAGGPWKPSIFMPRWASRITLEVTGVRVERVQEITNEDAWAEGCTAYGDREYWQHDPMGPVVLADTPRDEFQMLWDRLNGNRGFGWDVNPWVWVIEFKRLKP